MGLQQLQRITTLFFLISIVVRSGYAQENAFAGSVRNKKGAPIPNVKVYVVQKPDIADTTRDIDGVYVLCVPKSLGKKVDIAYEHPSYLRDLDEDIGNEQEQNKRPIRELRPNNVAGIGELSKPEIDQIVVKAYNFLIRASLESLPTLSEIANDNLKSLSNAATILAESGRTYSKNKNYNEAEYIGN